MTEYLLDSDVLIEMLRGTPIGVRLISLLGLSQVGISTVTIAEIMHGLEYDGVAETQRATFESLLLDAVVIPFDVGTARVFGKQRARLQKLGMNIEDLDLMIAATAVQHGLILVTRNQKHMARAEGIRLFEGGF